MTISVRAGKGVTLVEVNLKFVWDVITGIRFGRTGLAYVVDGQGQLVSHPDISLVLKKTDVSALPQVHQARAVLAAGAAGPVDTSAARDLSGLAVLAASAHIKPVDWFVFVEQSREEAFAPLFHSMLRTGLLMLLGLVLALAASAILVRRMVEPIQALQEGAARMGAGELDQRIEVHTNDEIEVLAREFNQMAAQLRESYAGLEKKVAERTEELVAANRAKSRFLAAASHDLRQPMHALGLFVTQLNSRIQDPENRRLTGRIEAAVTALQSLLDALLDVSRLDAGVVTPNLTAVPIEPLLKRIEDTFAPDATEKELRFRVVRSGLAVKSDPVLLERILINLVANAVRYTERGGILIGCRRRGGTVRLEVWDTGVGIAPEHQSAVFQEFYQVGNPERDRQKGLGLGLAIAARLARLLGARIDLRSVPGRGSGFAVELPRAEAARERAVISEPVALDDRLRGACVLVVDDDTLVREALTGLMEQWGCEVIAAADGAGALAAVEALGAKRRRPDTVLCDYRLPAEETGGEVIRRLRERLGPDLPAALITGDTAPERLREAREAGVPLLHKPVQPARLRALIEHLVASRTEHRKAI